MLPIVVLRSSTTVDGLRRSCGSAEVLCGLRLEELCPSAPHPWLEKVSALSCLLTHTDQPLNPDTVSPFLAPDPGAVATLLPARQVVEVASKARLSEYSFDEVHANASSTDEVYKDVAAVVRSHCLTGRLFPKSGHYFWLKPWAATAIATAPHPSLQVESVMDGYNACIISSAPSGLGATASRHVRRRVIDRLFATPLGTCLPFVAWSPAC